MHSPIRAVEPHMQVLHFEFHGADATMEPSESLAVGVSQPRGADYGTLGVR